MFKLLPIFLYFQASTVLKGCDLCRAKLVAQFVEEFMASKIHLSTLLSLDSSFGGIGMNVYLCVLLTLFSLGIPSVE